MPEAPNWHATDKAYQVHHVGCPQCIAAGINRSFQVRCPAGQALWDSYCSAVLPPYLSRRPAPAQVKKHPAAKQASIFRSETS